MSDTVQSSRVDGVAAEVRSGHPRPGLLLLLLCMAEFMIVLDFSITNVALPSIQTDLGFSTNDLQWVVSAYALGFGGFLLLGGRIADLYGRKRVFLWGTLVFSLASLVAGFADNAGTLIALRGAQGLAAAFVGPAAFSLITTSFSEGPERNRALGAYGAVLSIGFVTGVIAGGVLTQLLDWRWVFFVNVPIGLLVAVFTPAMVRETSRPESRTTLDIPGALTITGAALTLVYGITAASTFGLFSKYALGALALSALLFVAFVLVEQRATNPLVPLEIFKLRKLVAANVVNLMLIAAFVGVTYVLTLHLQQVEKFSPLQTGLTFAILGLTAMIAGLTAGKVAGKIGLNAAMIIGVVLQAIGTFACAVLPTSGVLIYVLIGTGFIGFGNILAVVMISIGATTGVPDHQQGLAGGLLQTTQQIGAALGAAGFAAIAASITSAKVPAGAVVDTASLVSGFRWTLIVAAAFAVVAAIIGALMLLPPSRQPVAAKS